MGTAVMGGTAAASAIAIFLIPVTFYAVGKLVRDPRKKKRTVEENDGADRAPEGGKEGTDA